MPWPKKTADALAQALSSGLPDEKAAAQKAMASIGHVKSSFYDWILSDAYLANRTDDILFIGLQETLSADMISLKQAGILPPSAELPDDPVKAHRIPAHFDQGLSTTAIANLEEWYRADIGLYNACLGWRQARWPQAAVPGLQLEERR